jgi:hypothetical protein
MRTDLRRFLGKCLLFGVLMVMLISLLFKISDFAIKQKMPQFFKISNDINIVFAGDSNVECSINDSIVKGSLNIAQSGEAYLYSYVKLRELLDCNKQIKTVFIGFSFHEILKEKEDLLLFQDSYIIEKIKLYNYLLNKTEKGLIFKNNHLAYLKGFLQSIFNNVVVFAKSCASTDSRSILVDFGGYLYLYGNKLKEDIRLQENTKQESSGKSPEKGLQQEKYLKMISQLCRQRSVRLILLNTPKHSYYSNRITKEIKDNWLSVRNSLPQDSLMELSSFPLSDSCYYDITHLNCIGANLFSKYLNEQIYFDKTDALEKDGD